MDLDEKCHVIEMKQSKQLKQMTCDGRGLIRKSDVDTGKE
jgi:hypothetical protein